MPQGEVPGCSGDPNRTRVYPNIFNQLRSNTCDITSRALIMSHVATEYYKIQPHTQVLCSIHYDLVHKS